MAIILKGGQPFEELKKKLGIALEKKNQGIDTSKYSGVIKTNIDPLEYQRKMRDEWE